MSSTYTINTVTFPTLCFMNSVWSELLCLNPYFLIARLNCPNHTGSDCFSPYSTRCSLHTTLVSVNVVYPGGSMYTSLKSPCRRHFLQQIDVMASQGWLQEITIPLQCSILQLVKSFLVVYPVCLCVAFCHQSCFVSFDCTICRVFDRKYQFAYYCFFPFT